MVNSSTMRRRSIRLPRRLKERRWNAISTSRDSFPKRKPATAVCEPQPALYFALAHQIAQDEGPCCGGWFPGFRTIPPGISSGTSTVFFLPMERWRSMHSSGYCTVERFEPGVAVTFRQLGFPSSGYTRGPWPRFPGRYITPHAINRRLPLTVG